MTSETCCTSDFWFLRGNGRGSTAGAMVFGFGDAEVTFQIKMMQFPHPLLEDVDYLAQMLC
jgi:hypothetical protein